MARGKSKKAKKYLFEYNLLFINILSFIILIAVMLLTYFIELNISEGFLENYGLFLLNNADSSSLDYKIIAMMVLIIIAMAFWLVLHEIIHGVFYRLSGAKKDAISYGVVLEKGILYCKCSDYVTKSNVLISVVAPFLLIGVVTYIIGMVFNLGWLVFLSILNICGAAGDLAMFFFFIRRDKDFKFKELEDSTTFCLETTEDLIGKKFMAVKLKKVIANEKEVKEKKNKLITVTKASWVFIIVIIIALLISLGTVLFG